MFVEFYSCAYLEFSYFYSESSVVRWFLYLELRFSSSVQESLTDASFVVSVPIVYSQFRLLFDILVRLDRSLFMTASFCHGFYSVL